MTSSKDEHLNDTSGTESEECPLFMTGLPTDFASNAQLKAIASLMATEDNSQQEEKIKLTQTPILSTGGGKVKSTNARRSQRQRTLSATPYSYEKKKKKQVSETNINETQLFMKMWKL